MGKVLVVYFSLTGKTRQMAEYIAEGVRFTEHQAVTKSTSEVNGAEDLNGYDGYIFGTPTYNQDVSGPVKVLLSQARDADLRGKLAGAFGSYTHSGGGPAIVLDTMRDEYQMREFYLGPFNLLEAKVETQEGMHDCHDYGRTFAEKLTEGSPQAEQAAESEAVPSTEGGDNPAPWALS